MRRAEIRLGSLAIRLCCGRRPPGGTFCSSRGAGTGLLHSTNGSGQTLWRECGSWGNRQGGHSAGWLPPMQCAQDSEAKGTRVPTVPAPLCPHPLQCRKVLVQLASLTGEVFNPTLEEDATQAVAVRSVAACRGKNRSGRIPPSPSSCEHLPVCRRDHQCRLLLCTALSWICPPSSVLAALHRSDSVRWSRWARAWRGTALLRISVGQGPDVVRSMLRRSPRSMPGTAATSSSTAARWLPIWPRSTARSGSSAAPPRPSVPQSPVDSRGGLSARSPQFSTQVAGDPLLPLLPLRAPVPTPRPLAPPLLQECVAYNGLDEELASVEAVFEGTSVLLEAMVSLCTAEGPGGHARRGGGCHHRAWELACSPSGFELAAAPVPAAGSGARAG